MLFGMPVRYNKHMDKKSLLKEVLAAYQGDTKALVDDLKDLHHRLHTAKPARDFSDKPVVVELVGVNKTYKLGKNNVPAADNVNIQIHQGEFVALVGPSGSGKSTILNMIGGLDKPSSGQVIIDGTDLKKLSDSKLSMYRNQKIGFVFQFFYLQPFLNLQTNVEVPTMFNRLSKSERHARSQRYIQAVGLEDRLRHLPKELSGGQMQRAAIARALMNEPKVLLADEPTGNLDSTNAQAIVDQFEAIREKQDTTVIMVTHDMKVANRADRVIELMDGKVVQS